MLSCIAVVISESERQCCFSSFLDDKLEARSSVPCTSGKNRNRCKFTSAFKTFSSAEMFFFVITAAPVLRGDEKGCSAKREKLAAARERIETHVEKSIQNTHMRKSSGRYSDGGGVRDKRAPHEGKREASLDNSKCNGLYIAISSLWFMLRLIKAPESFSLSIRTRSPARPFISVGSAWEDFSLSPESSAVPSIQKKLSFMLKNFFFFPKDGCIRKIVVIREA